MTLNLIHIAFFCFIVCLLPLNEGLSCDRIGACECQMSDGSGTINLASLASTNGNPAFSITDDVGRYWSYRYNPCVPFTFGSFTDLAMLQVATRNRGNRFNLGVQRSETFTYSSASGVSIKYDDNPSSPVRNSSVLLICNSASRRHTLRFIGELKTTEYDFILSGPCACPGGCDDSGVIVPTTTTANPNTTAMSSTTTESTVPRTTTAKLTVSSAKSKPAKSSFNWSHLSNVLAGLIFHDFILVFIIAALLIVAKRVCNFDICRAAGQYEPKRFSNDL